jgi:hypothetical protein
MAFRLSVFAALIIVGMSRGADTTPVKMPGVPVGGHAPRFRLKDQNGSERDLNEFLKKGKVAVVFYRSVRW